jgi:hypothetical protein
MPNFAYITFTVRNLPLGTTDQDVRNHINSLVSGNPNPLIGAVIEESSRLLCYTIATIRQDSDSGCKAARDRLHGSTIYPSAPTSFLRDSQIIVNQEFLGVTTIAEHEDAQFE